MTERPPAFDWRLGPTGAPPRTARALGVPANGGATPAGRNGPSSGTGT